MSATPTPKAWEADEFWSEVVNVLSLGRRLRSDHYLNPLSAADLDQLRLALSSSGSQPEQQKFCPPRRGGKLDGELPSIRCLSDIQEAMRQTWMLRGLERNQLVETAVKKRCGTLGLNSQMTSAVLQVVGEEALVQHAQGVVGDFSLKAAFALMKREEQLLDREKFEELKRKAEKADQAKKVIESAMSPEEQRRRLKEILK